MIFLMVYAKLPFQRIVKLQSGRALRTALYTNKTLAFVCCITSAEKSWLTQQSRLTLFWYSQLDDMCCLKLVKA